MKKTAVLFSIFMSLLIIPPSYAEIGYVDYGYISKNYPLAQRYNAVIKNKAQAIKLFAQEKDKQAEMAQNKAEKERIKQQSIAQVQAKQNELKNLKRQYEDELTLNVQRASERVRINKRLDVIIKSDVWVTGGIDCTKEVVEILKSQNANMGQTNITRPQTSTSQTRRPTSTSTTTKSTNTVRPVTVTPVRPSSYRR